MQQALRIARQAEQAGEVPIGAVLVHNGAVIASAHNHTERDKDVTAHAEINVIREGGKTLDSRILSDCDLYVTLEPCPMCAQAISFARIRRLYFGAYDSKGGGVDHGPRMFQQASCFHAPEVIGGMLESECGALLRDFFQARR